MSNTYYRYKKTQIDKGSQPGQERTVNMELSLTAYVGPKGSPNCLQLTLQTDDKSPLTGIAYITLTEKEQDELIAGILERRGIIVNTVDPKWDWLHIDNKAPQSISATGNEQSSIHPAED